MVHNALQTLSETHRQILKDTLFRTYVVSRIATILNVPIGTVMSRFLEQK